MLAFYTYVWLRKDGTPYYIGKGHGDRAYRHDRPNARRPRDRSRIVTQVWPDESTAFEAERLLIARFGRKDNGTGILRNLTDGGEGSSGYKQTPAANERRSVSCRRRWSAPAFKEYVRRLRAHVYTAEHQSKAGRAGGRVRSEKKTKHLQRISFIGGHVAARTGQAATIAHIRWHVNRGIVKPECILCK